MAQETGKVVREQGGDLLRVDSGGVIDIKTGGIMKANGTQASALVDVVHAVGTADGTIVDVGGAFSQGTLNDNFKECSARLNAITAALRGVGIIP